jgi:hypothetical protein
MSATNASHGVINIEAKIARPAPLEAVLSSAPAPTVNHPIATGAAPEPVVQHKTAAEIEAEAAALQVAADQLKTDAANVAPAA